ncbi:zinc finger protein 585A isoform X2 [Cryptotermes secundus]|nr:zinc finger protein 585A isoform X2 [Cryptotermes secundus]
MSYRLCSDHFDDKCYTSTERRRLSNFALPEIFTHNSGSLETGNIDTQLEHDISEEQGEISADLLCRICACTSEDLVPVFGERGLEMQLLDKIHTHLPIMVTADDLLPITVCMDCVYKLEMCHEFVHSCLEADTKLREFLGFSADNEEYTEEYGETQSSLEIKEESDDDQDTGMFDDSCDNQDGGGYMEHTDVMEISQDELHSVDSYVQEEYVIEDSADAQLEDEAIADHMQEESAHLRSEQCENDRSQSAETEKPKFKVVVVKMKNTPDMTQDDQIEKALGVLKNVQDTSHSVTEKQHFVDQKTLEQSQEQERLCLKSSDIELPDGLTVCLFDESSMLNLPGLSNEETTTNIKQEQQMSPDLYDETVSTVSVKNEVHEEGITQDVSKKPLVDHSYTRWDQTVYSCMYCKRTFFGKDNLVSHQTVSHPEKVFCCPECDIIVYESKQFFEEHEKTHLSKPECGENTLKVNWHMSENCCLTESKCVVSDNGSISEMINSRESKIDDEAHKACSLETDLKSGMALPPMKMSEQDMSSLHKKEADTQNIVEIMRVAEIFVEPERSILKKGPFQSNSKFRVKICKNFENVESNVKSKVIRAIRGIIKMSENDRKVVGKERPCQNSEEVQEKTRTQEITAWNEMKREVNHKYWKCKRCDHLSVSWEEHRNHIREHPPVSFHCTCCDKEFPSKARLQCHMFVHTQEKRFICEYCGKGFSNKHALKNHQYTHNEGEKTFECQDCGKKLGTRRGYDSHCASHTEASCLCDVCGKSMKHLNSLRLHRLTHIDPNFFRRCCTVCGKTCRNRYLLTEHMRVHSDERPYSCTQCGKCFHKRSQLSQHMVIHADARQHICSVCGKIFNRLGNMKMHAKTHEDSNKSMCKICKRTFNSMGELISHRRTHTKEEIEEAMKQPENQGAEPLVFVCDVCGKQLASKLTLKYHMMIHAGDKPFRCEICDKRFALKTKLQLHERIHSSKKPFQCSFCTEGFQTKQYKIIHERIHTGERPYKCMQCTKAFRSRMLLNQHMLVHSDLRPFKCSLCDKSFRRRDTLDTHMRIHTGERPYSCNICGRGFKQKGDCNKHQRTHFKGRKTAVQILDSAGSVIFSCALCGAHFDLKEELDAHFEAYHSSDVVVSSNTMIINTENLVPVTEIAQDEKPIVLTDYGQECDAS